MRYSLNGENENALYRQSFVIYRSPLRQVFGLEISMEVFGI
jgi:hypothetical protein